MDWFVDFLVRHEDGTEEAYYIVTKGDSITNVLVKASQRIYERFHDDHFFINHVWASPRQHCEELIDVIMLDGYATTYISDKWGGKW